MSMNVYVVTREGSPSKKRLHDGFIRQPVGFESYGSRFYAPLCDFSLELLPLLSCRNVAVEGEQLPLLEQEVSFVIERSEDVARATGIEAKLIRTYMERILAAIHFARSVGGGVEIM